MLTFGEAHLWSERGPLAFGAVVARCLGAITVALVPHPHDREQWQSLEPKYD